MSAVITGANGFVGQALWRRLSQQGVDTLGIARRALTKDHFSAGSYTQFDLSGSVDKLVDLFKGREVVFHVASKVDLWGPYQEFYNANVIATQNVIQACRAANVKYLIYTSSPSVVSDGKDLCNVNEDYPYPSKHLAFYPTTKAIAEQLVRAAGRDQLATISLRPHLIWGPGDQHLIPTILERAHQGRLVQIGNGENLVDNTYIDDCVEAHINAWNALRERTELSSNVYFISQGQPVKMWGWIREILASNNLSTKLRKIPFALAYAVAVACEAKANLTKSHTLPLLTRFTVDQLSTSHYFDISRARKDLNFEPKQNVTV